MSGFCVSSSTDPSSNLLSTYAVSTTEIDLCVLLIPTFPDFMGFIQNINSTGWRTFSLGQTQPQKTRKPSRFRCTLRTSTVHLGNAEGGLSSQDPGRGPGQADEVGTSEDKGRAAGRRMRELGCVMVGWLN